MQHYAAFPLGLHYLQKYSFRIYPNTKGYALIEKMGEEKLTKMQ